MAKLRITYRKSAIGYSKDQKATVRSLGLRKLNSIAVHDDIPSIRGMAFKVRHLVTVEEVPEDTPARPPRKAKATVSVKAAPSATTAERRKAEPSASTAKPAPKTVAPVASEPVATSEPAQAEAPVAAKNEPAKGAGSNDLTVIEGIGPKIAVVLNEAGITTLDELAAADVDRLNEILQQADLRLADASTWPEQAALAAASKWDEFHELTGQLKGGRRV